MAETAHETKPEGGKAGGGEKEEPEGAVNVSELVKEAKEKGLTKSLKEKLEGMTTASLDRFIDALGDAKQYKPIVSLAKEIKEHKDKVKELAPHSEKKDGWSGQGYKGHGEKNYDFHLHKQQGDNALHLHEHDKEDHSNEANFYYYRNDKGQSRTETGDVARKAGEKYEEREKKEEQEKRDKEGFIGKHTHVGGTFAKAEGEKHVAVAEGKKEFGSKEGFGGSVSGDVLSAKAKGSAEFGYDRDKGLTAGAKGEASANLASGSVDIHSKPLTFSIAGEQFVAQVSGKADGFVGAQAKGSVEVNLKPSGVGAEVDASAFAGAKVTASVSGTLNWNKKSGAAYAADAAAHAKDFLTNWIPESIANHIPTDKLKTVLEFVLPKILGADAGEKLILGATLSGSASAGIGAEAKGSFKFDGGVIHCSGKAGLTVGVGLGGDFDISIGAFDGMRCLAVLLTKGFSALGERLHPAQSVTAWLKSKAAEAKAAIKQYCVNYAHDPQHGRIAKMIMGWIGEHI